MNKTVQERIDDQVSAFLSRKMEMLGKSPPSTKVRRIPDDEKSLLKWAGASNSLVSRYPAQTILYEDVVVSRYDLEKYCDFLKRIGSAKC
jgi:hypothetical protein